MYVADRWKDYELIDASGGERLERWGRYILVRPDPQVIWNTQRIDERWRKFDARYHRSSSGGGEWEFINLPKIWTVRYALGKNQRKGLDHSQGQHPDMVFHLKPFSFKHTGLFPEQAVNWEWFAEKIDKETKCGRRVRVLNLFAYTGGATLAALSAGAAVTHVDASRGMVAWAKENAASSCLAGAPVRWLVDDCRKFVEREIRRNNRYDAVIMDPPSYGRGPKGEVWKLGENIHEMVRLSASLLSDHPLFYLINSYTTALAPAVLTYLVSLEVVSRFGGRAECAQIGLPVTDSGLILPCGCCGRWEAV